MFERRVSKLIGSVVTPFDHFKGTKISVST